MSRLLVKEDGFLMAENYAAQGLQRMKSYIALFANLSTLEEMYHKGIQKTLQSSLSDLQESQASLRDKNSPEFPSVNSVIQAFVATVSC